MIKLVYYFVIVYIESHFFLKGNAYFYAVFLVISEYMHLGSVVWVRDIISLNNLQPDDVSPIQLFSLTPHLKLDCACGFDKAN